MSSSFCFFILSPSLFHSYLILFDAIRSKNKFVQYLESSNIPIDLFGATVPTIHE